MWLCEQEQSPGLASYAHASEGGQARLVELADRSGAAPWPVPCRLRRLLTAVADAARQLRGAVPVSEERSGR